MLAETAALRLGTTVANAAGKLWLGGAQRDQERLLPMEELVRVRVPGIRLQREVRQQFEQITNAVFDRLEPFLKHAFQRLDEGGREAVINAVSDTFIKADLSDEALIGANVKSGELVRRITKSTEYPVGLNETEARLYDMLLAECVEYYTRIVRSLPVFEERVAVELLARTATLGSEIARILERLPDRSILAPDGTDQDTAFHSMYMELVSRDLDEVELFRRPSDQAASPRVRLSVAYVSLMATGADEKRQGASRNFLPLRPDMSFWEESSGEGSGVQVESALSNSSRVLLRGDAGSGKTTLLRWLAIMAARGSFSGELADWNGLTPIMIKLREYSGYPPPKPEEMLDGIAGSITGLMPKGWVERQLNDGKALLLIDGVDELLDRDRRAVREWLRRLLAQYTGVRVVITSRPAAAAADWLRNEEFAAVHLDRMTPPSMAAFVRQWHQAVRDLGSELPCPVEEIPQYEQSLLASLKDRAHLQSLAGTPLLVAMLCAMHLNRGRQLPRDRMELYRNALHTLVHDRDADRNVPSAADSKLSLSDKLNVLQDLAWRLSDNNRSEIDLTRAAEYVTSKLRSMRHLDDLDGDAVLDQLRHRSGVLRSPAMGRLDFVHRTFQEYLAAQEAAEEDRIGNLTGRAHLDIWRETIIMAAGHANRRQREELLDGILDRAEQEPRHARRLRLLAAACQETLPSMSDRLAERLERVVVHLLPAQRKTDPPALAAVGGSLLRWLPNSLAELTAKSAAQTVRTVALIGGEEALQILSGYKNDPRSNVAHELVQAWSYFDAERYVDDILSNVDLTNQEVAFTHSGQLGEAHRLHAMREARIAFPVQDMGFLENFPSLKNLWVSALRGESSLCALRNHPDLERLIIFGGRLKDYRVLVELNRLAWLTLPMNGEVSMDLLQELPELVFLGMSGLKQGTDLSPVADLSTIRYLHLAGYRRTSVTGLDRMERMANLHDLYFFGYDVNSWIASLKSPPPSVRRIYFNDCVVPNRGEVFEKFESLIHVDFGDCVTVDGSPVTGMTIPDVTVQVNDA
ncbi:NACHT domain-containing protein [Streptomyces globisporus]|uniref:NACHT N-terminal Helical domain 1-containing protein n=1 Tax=Streptomyces globisporus TaxID=1908 RepID=UPI00345FB2C1